MEHLTNNLPNPFGPPLYIDPLPGPVGRRNTKWCAPNDHVWAEHGWFHMYCVRCRMYD